MDACAGRRAGARRLGRPVQLRSGSPTDNCVWAPEVAAVDGGYARYYTARDRASGRQCIGVATSASPDGPFAPVGTDPLVCPTAEGGASYATASELLGPYTKSPVPLMTTELMDDQVAGPGEQDIVTAKDRSTKIVFHGWDPTYTYRAMYLRDLSWVDDRPYVEGAAVRYEAESGVVTDARVQQNPGASGDGASVAWTSRRAR